MKRPLLFILMILLAVSCKKIDPFVETDEGKNVLGFYLDGEKVTYTTSGGFPSEYPYRHCVYTKQINADSLEISAELDNSIYRWITIQIALADISTNHSITDPDITLTYLYRKCPISPGIHTEGGRHFEHSYTEFVRGKMSFRNWDQESGILSGNFHFNCDAPQRDGSVKHISVTKGTFDVSINHDYQE